jgi:hypothetical protein
MDSELLDLKFNNIGDSKSIESDILTDREIGFLKSLFKNKEINLNDLNENKLLFAVQGSWVDKWTFLNNLNWPALEVKLIKVETKTNLGSMTLWTGTNWDKSLKKLKKSM